MKILHLISQRPDSTGSGIYLQQLMVQAHRSGHTNYLICGLSGDEAVDLKGLTAERILPVRFSTSQTPGAIVGMSDVMPYESRMFRNLTMQEIDHYLDLFRSNIHKAIKTWRPDLIHSHHLWLVSSLATEVVAELPVVSSCHGSDLRQWQQCSHLRDKVADGCRKLHRVLTLSQEQKKQVASTYEIRPECIEVVGAGYDDQLFTSVRHPSGSESPPTILYAGKLSRAKGVVWLLRALQKLDHCAFHLHLVGSGQGGEARQCLDEAEKLGDRVTVHGPVDQHRLAGLLQSSGLFVLPSLYEGLPLVVLEALGCGCRVVATDLPGCREVAKRSGTEQLQLVPTPIVIDTDSTTLENEDRFVNDLIEALTPFLKHRPLLSEAAVDLTYFRWSSVYQRVEKVWRDLLSTTRHR